MLRKVVAASVILVLCGGVVFAEEFFAVITKVEGNKVSFFKMEGKGKEAKKTGDETTMPVSKNAKIVKGKFNKETKSVEAGDELEGGLTHKMFTDINPEKGRRVMMVTEGKKITEIRVFGGGKKKQQ
jgi:hypothetical protein